MIETNDIEDDDDEESGCGWEYDHDLDVWEDTDEFFHATCRECGAGEGLELHEYLGMSWHEFGLWVTGVPASTYDPRCGACEVCS